MNNTRDRIDEESRKDPESLEREIDQQRDSIGQIVNALENRLSPGEIVDRLLNKGAGAEFARNFGTAVKANPVPAVLVGAGLAWLYVSRNDSPSAPRMGGGVQRTYRPASPSSTATGGYSGEDDSGPGLVDGIKERASHVKDRASHLGEGVAKTWSNTTSRVGSMAHGVGDSAHHMADGVRNQTQRAVSGFSHMLNENPMAAGAIAIAVGALLGAALPMSEKENRLMGETGDKLRGKAGEVADTVRTKGAEVAQELGQAASGGSQNHAGSSNGNNGSSSGSGSGKQPGGPQASL